MDENLEGLINIITTNKPITNDILSKLTSYFEQINGNLLIEYLDKNFDLLCRFERWLWDKFCVLNDDLFQQSNTFDFLQTIALFNKNLIFVIPDEFDAQKKFSLLFPDDINSIEQILEQIQSSTNDNDLYVYEISLWFDNLAYFIDTYTQFVDSPVVIQMNYLFAMKYFMTDKYRVYLLEIQEQNFTPTYKQSFYIRTCSFVLSTYFFCKKQSFPYTAEDMLRYYSKDFLKFIENHYLNISSWSKDVLSYVAHIMNFLLACCWWRGDPQKHVHIVMSTKQQAENNILRLIHILNHRIYHERIEPSRSNDETILIDTTISFLLRLLLIYDSVCFIRKKTHLVDLLLPIAEKPINIRLSLRAYALLGEILCDDKLKDLKVGQKLYEYYFYILENAWQHPAQTFHRATVYHLLRGLTNLAKNDCIQQITINLNKIPLLIEMSDKYPVAYEILWALSFNRDIQQQLRSNPAFMMNLLHLKPELDNEQMRKVVHGIRWNLEITHDNPEQSDTDSEQVLFDFMISYSHKNKNSVKQIYDALIQHGYRVWIDFDKMHGNVMDAMAQAIEQSKMVIICMSEQYRRSNYCRAEAFYAFQRQLKIVPVLVEKYYKPDGWLLFLVGQLLYVDFTKHEFSQAIDMLFKEIHGSDGEPKVDDAPADSDRNSKSVTATLPKILPLPAIVSSKPLDNLYDWSSTDVQEWLIEQNLNQMAVLLQGYDGKNLIYLNKYLKYGDSKDVLKCLENDSSRRTNQILSLVELAQLESLLSEQQIQSISSQKIKKNRNQCGKLCKLM